MSTCKDSDFTVHASFYVCQSLQYTSLCLSSPLMSSNLQVFCADVNTHDFLWTLIFNATPMHVHVCIKQGVDLLISRTSISGTSRSRAADECKHPNQMTTICYLWCCCCCVNKRNAQDLVKVNEQKNKHCSAFSVINRHVTLDRRL